MNKRSWTPKEDEYLKNNFDTLTLSKMATNLNCSINTVKNRAIFLGLEVTTKTKKIWTTEEIELLKIMAPKYLNKTIAKKLNRSVKELNKKARELEIKLIFKRPVWKKWKIKYLKENINVLPISKIQSELEIHYYQIMDKLEELGIEYNSSYYWTEEEVNILTELSTKVYIGEIAKILHRNEAAVISKATKMNLDYIVIKQSYTEEELQYIKDNWGIIPITDIARNLKVTRIMIQNQADKMNLPKLGSNPYRKWAEPELEKLRTLAPKKTITELAKIFNTTNDAITSIASRNSIILNDAKIHWTKEDNETLKELAKTLDLSELALIMNRSTSAIRLQAERQNITIIPNKKSSESIWTEENTKELQKLVNEGKTLLEICNLMHKKDLTILKKVKTLNLNLPKTECKEWTDCEINRLKELAKTKKLSELVKELNRTSSSIKAIASKHKITIINDRQNWTAEEYKLLEKLTMIDKKTPKEIAAILNRTEDAIIIKINRRGLKTLTNDKRFWTPEEETLLSDLWGTKSIEKIAKKLNRSVSSIKNKANFLHLGSALKSNYNGLTIKDISDLFNVNLETVSVSWISLGLKYKVQKISKSRSYRYVEINDLYDFLKENQNIWDSRNLEKNILGIEPPWLQAKRNLDKIQNQGLESLNLTKQQLILSKKFFLNLKEEITTDEYTSNQEQPLSLKRSKK